MIKFIKKVASNVVDCLKRMGEGFAVAGDERYRPKR